MSIAKSNNTFYNKVASRKSPYIIAEIGANHNGDMRLAKKLILLAKKNGADCVKFQSWTHDTVFSNIKYNENYFLNDDYTNRKDFNLKDIVKKFEMSQSQLFQMKKFCILNKIDFASTPFSKQEVNYLVDDLKPKFIKIASMDLNNYPFIEYISQKNLPIIISTGLSHLYELDKAIKIIEKNNKQIIIMHCIANYPPKDTEINLNNIKTLSKLYPYPIGFSDHSIGFSIPLAAIAMGAIIIEKHFTLDKNMFGWDHKVSATADELKIICDQSKRVIKSLGSFNITVPESKNKIREFRRSIVINKDINKGERIKHEDLDFKRPGRGISPENIEFVINRKLKFDKKKDDILYKMDLD
jgi:N-acetylneuraminate synthase